MSLFERLKNKRYDLQEKKKFSPKGQGELFPDPWESGSSSNNTSTSTSTETPSSSGNASSGGKSKGSGSRTTRVGGNKPKPKPTGRGFEDITGEGNVKPPKTRKELIAKRKQDGINKDGVPSKDGIKRYATKTKQLQSGSNRPVKLTQKDLDIAKERMVGGKPIKNKAGQIIGKTTGKYGGKLSDLATKAERTATKKAIEMSKTINAKPLPKVYDAKASKELGTDVFKRVRKKISSTKTRPGRIIDTPKRRIKILTPVRNKPVTFPSSPLRPSNRIYTPSPSELQKLTSSGFKKTTTGAFTKAGKKSFKKLLVKGLSKMGTKGKIAAGLLALGTTTYGINKLRTVNKTKKQNTMVPPIGFNQTPPKPMKFGISLGPGQQQK